MLKFTYKRLSNSRGNSTSSSGTNYLSKEAILATAEEGRLSDLVRLLKDSTNPTVDKIGRHPVHLAAQNGHLQVVKYLLTSQAQDSMKQDSFGCTPLHLASSQGHLEVVKVLLKEGNQALNVKNQFGNTALHEACYRGHLKIVKYLLQKKADRQIQNQDGNQPSHLACQNGHLEVLKLLIKAGVDINAHNIIGDTCLHIAVKFDHLPVVKGLLQVSANINATNREGNTALHCAVYYNRRLIAHFLKESGAALIKNCSGQTPADLGTKYGAEAIFIPEQQTPELHAKEDSAMKSFLKAASRSGSKKHSSVEIKDISAPMQTLPEAQLQPVCSFNEDKTAAGKLKQKSKKPSSPLSSKKRSGEYSGPPFPDPTQELTLVIKEEEDATKTPRDMLDGHDAEVNDDISALYEQRRHRKSKSRSKAIKKVVYDRGIYRKSRRTGASSISSLSTCGQEDNLYTVYDGDFLTKPGRKRRSRLRDLNLDDHPLKSVAPSSTRESRLASKCRCGCARQISLLDTKIEMLKEAILDELNISEEITDKKVSELDQRLGYQVSCTEKLCKERVAAERVECLHRIDRRALHERLALIEEIKKVESRIDRSVRAWCEARYERVNKRLPQTGLLRDDSGLSEPSACSPKRRHSFSGIGQRSQSAGSTSSGYRDSGAFEANSKSSSQDYPVGVGSALSPDIRSVFETVDERCSLLDRALYSTNDPPDDSCTEDESNLKPLAALPSDVYKTKDFISLAITSPFPPKDSSSANGGSGQNSLEKRPSSAEDKPTSDEMLSNFSMMAGRHYERLGTREFTRPSPLIAPRLNILSRPSNLGVSSALSANAPHHMISPLTGTTLNKDRGYDNPSSYANGPSSSCDEKHSSGGSAAGGYHESVIDSLTQRISSMEDKHSREMMVLTTMLQQKSNDEKRSLQGRIQSLEETLLRLQINNNASATSNDSNNNPNTPSEKCKNLQCNT